MGRREYMRRYMRQRRAKARESKEAEDGTVLWKCKDCGEWFPISDFPPKGRGRLYVCRSCAGREVEVEEYEEKAELEAFLLDSKK